MLEELKTFVAVVEYKNFTKAAEKINLSQPSVSMHIKHLESYFNVTLIRRSIKHKKIFITEEGKLLYQRAKQLINFMNEVKVDLLNKKHVISGNIRIGASFTIGEYILPEFLKGFSGVYNNISFQVIIKNTAEIINMVKNLEIDIGLIEGIVPAAQFKYEYFCKDKMVLAVPYNHLLSKKKVVTVKDLQNNVWISRELGSGTKEYLDFFLSSNGINPKNIITFGSNYAVKEAVKMGMGFAIISSYVTKKPILDKEISLVNLKENYVRKFSYILNRDSIIPKSVSVFIDELKKFVNDF